MASICHDSKNRRPAIQFRGSAGKRQTIRLGKVTTRQAESAKLHVEQLLACKVTGTAPPRSTAEWVAAVPDPIRLRLERTGLIEAQERPAGPGLAKWLKMYRAGRRDVKAGTATFYGHTARNLIEFFGKDRPLGEITAGDADDFRIYLATEQDLAESTVRRRCRVAKQFFAAARKKRLIIENPFGEMKHMTDPGNKAREHFITAAEAAAVLDACPDRDWRLIFALCRYGGLRCPSEILRLRWGDVDWVEMRFTVHASKTEHVAGGGVRQVPIFPELEPYLRDSFDQAKPKAVDVITRYRDTNANLRTQLNRIIKRAGLVPWPRLFQNLRSTRETELAESFPLHVVCDWIGNKARTAMKHYLQVTADHFARASGQPLRPEGPRSAAKSAAAPASTGAQTTRTPPQDETAVAPKPAFGRALRDLAAPCETLEPQDLGRAGPVTLSVNLPAATTLRKRPKRSAALFAWAPPLDAELARLGEAWPDVDQAGRALLADMANALAAVHA